MENSEVILKIDDVSFEYGKLKVLEQISFDVKKNETVCILGPSGCGKTTLLRLISGLAATQHGNVTVSGVSSSQGHDYKQHLGLVFQEPRLLPWRTTIDNVLIPFELNQDKVTEEQKEKGLQALKLVGLESFAENYSHELSGGMRQRVALARAIVTDPDILLLDEPLTGLDVHTKEELQDEILSLKEKTKRTMLWVTHDPQEAIYIADRIIVLSNRPTVVREIISVNEPYPRTRMSQNALDLEKRIRKLFSED